MEVQLKSIKHELRRFSTVDYVEEFAECIIKDEHTRKCIIERSLIYLLRTKKN